MEYIKILSGCIGCYQNTYNALDRHFTGIFAGL